MSTYVPFEHEFIPATFIERPNRFIGVFTLPDGSTQKGHIADPGRLKELLYPSAKVLVSDHGTNTKRKLRYSIPLVYSEAQDNQPPQLVSINSQLPNRLIKTLLEQKQLPSFEQYTLVKREFTYGHSRIDFLLESPSGQPTLVEVKGASLVEEDICRFPDAPTERGTKHVTELTKALKDGYQCHVIFVVQRSDAKQFEPHYKQDMKFAQTLKNALEQGVHGHAFTFLLEPTGCTLQNNIPIHIPKAVETKTS